MEFTVNKESLKNLEIAMHSADLPKGMSYQLPPNTFAELKGEFINFIDNKKLVTRFFIDKRFSNPQGTVQGGIIAACFDDTFGPLSVGTSGKPILTTNMNVQYIRPVPLEQDIYIVTEIVSISRSNIYLRADAFNSNGKLLAQASTNQLILK